METWCNWLAHRTVDPKVAGFSPVVFVKLGKQCLTEVVICHGESLKTGN